MKDRKVILWTSGIDFLLNGEGVVGGLTVQMMQWAKIFAEKGWRVISYSESASFNNWGIKFYYFPVTRRASLALEVLLTIYYIFRVRPDLIIFRGASRSIYLLGSLASLLNIKFVFMGASDVNFIPGCENIAGPYVNQILYQKGLSKVDKVVVQNSTQSDLIFSNYSKKALIIPNIWFQCFGEKCRKDVIIWVGNFRRLKRPEWFIRLASGFPEKIFCIAGFPTEKNLYERCRTLSEGKENLQFLGPLSFQESESLFDSAKVLICSSEYEGFPNTFLQAWSRGIPVVSTVNPSSVITNNNLGLFVETEDQLYEAVRDLCNNHELYEEMRLSIIDYFSKEHDPERYYEELIKII